MAGPVIKEIQGNLMIKDCPVLIPKQNMGLFGQLQDAAASTDNMKIKSGQYGNTPK